MVADYREREEKGLCEVLIYGLFCVLSVTPMTLLDTVYTGLLTGFLQTRKNFPDLRKIFSDLTKIAP